MTKLPGFESLNQKEYERNAGRIADVGNLNRRINEVTKKYSTQELIDLFNEATIPISKVNTIEEVVEDLHVKPNLLWAKDSKTEVKIAIAPPPFNTPYLKSGNRMLSFPPRFGEHNEEIYGGLLGYSAAQLKEFKENKII